MKNEKLTDYKKVRIEGGSVILTLGKIVPRNWRLVQLQVLERNENWVVVKIVRVA